MVNAQQWLDKEYPNEKRKLIRSLYISEKGLEGHLDLREFVNLERLDCSFNQLVTLDFNGLTKLQEIRCNDNYLTNIDYSCLNPDTLIWMNITDNNLSKQDLSVFSHLVNLKYLWIGSSDKEKIDKGIYNRFAGSLKSLERMSGLRSLYINNTDVNGGVNYLPESVDEVHYSSEERPKSKVKEIEEKLTFFLNSKGEKDWKDIHPDFTELERRGWKRLGFSCQQTKEWIDAGLAYYDYHFAAYLRSKEVYNSQQTLNWEVLKKEDRSAQNWLDNECFFKEKKEISELIINKSGLERELIIKDFPNL